MQVIIPLAGKGTRLRPHTHLVPKPLLKVAGRPVMDWVMDRLEGLDVEEDSPGRWWMRPPVSHKMPGSQI